MAKSNQFMRNCAIRSAVAAIITVGLTTLCWIPSCATASPEVIVDAIPTGAALFNIATVRLPYSDLGKIGAKEVEVGIASALSNAMRLAEENAVTYVSLLSAAGDSSQSFTVDLAHAKLKLQPMNPFFVMLLYRGGRYKPGVLTYSFGNADANRRHLSITFTKISVPAGWTTDAWVYFNLSRIQDEASKVGATQVFLTSGGKGSSSPIIIPGIADPLMVFVRDTTITATWYLENN